MSGGPEENQHGIAIIGMAGRFPDAANVQEYWENLVAGRDCITRLTDEQLAASGYDPKVLRSLDGYVAARGLVEKPEWFDRGFFGIPPKEAEVIDPQHRVFLEISWDALEDAGCDPSRYPGLIGVFAGMSNNTYYPYFVRQRPDLLRATGTVGAVIANEKDFLTTRLAYKLNLRGPALNIQTACSSSLVAVCVACENLLNHQCDVALAGGVSLTFPQERGYFYQEGSMTSPDGRCRPFDADAGGTVFSSGAGVVTLKRLADALAEGDRIYAVIKGQAINNDGSHKVSFAAPSVDGHSEVIAFAQAVAGVSPDTISYIEAHGTATPLGDPIEVAGLAQVFRAATDASQFCALGSVKGNLGHLDAASGVASLIKAALAMEREQIPASLHCDTLNPALNIEQTPFFINTTLRPWPKKKEAPRRAGVSSFGVGGTNAHLILEEAPDQPSAAEGRPAQILVLSAKTAAALEHRAAGLAAHLEKYPELALADAAFTLQTGRQIFPHRRVVIERTGEGAIRALRGPARFERVEDRLDTPAVLLFPGQGAQYAGMGSGLARTETSFRDAIDDCAAVFRPHLGLDLREIIFSTAPDADARLRETRFTQPAIFTLDYALGRFWMSLGLHPAALLGHSVGEFAAAALAGIFSLEDAAKLVATRAQLVQELPGGAMLAARLPEEETAKFLAQGDLSLAAVNGPRLCVFAGPHDAIEALEAKLQEHKIVARLLSTSHAFHSAMVEPVVEPFARLVRTIPLRAPAIPIVSSVTGQWLKAEEATDPNYWARHLRATVRFGDAVSHLFEIDGCALIEAGPGQTLAQLARQCAARTSRNELVHSLADESDEDDSVATAIGRLWLAGVPVDWQAVHGGEARRRVRLPGYPFERQRYFADLPPGVPMPLTTAATDGEAPMTGISQASIARAIPAAETPAIAAGTGAEKGADNGMLAELKRLLIEISGFDLKDAPPSTNLLELGFDSLALSQAALTLSAAFGTKITFRQLLRDLGTLETLSAYLATETAGKIQTPAPAAAPINGDVLPIAHGPFRPLQREAAAELEPAQKRWLEDFIRRYVERTAGSKRIVQEGRRHLADPRAAAGFKQLWKEMVYPIVAERSSGAKLWDIDGNEWNDVTLSFGAAMLGHQPPFILEAVSAQLARGMEIGPSSPLAGDVAALLCELTGMERATFCNTGSEAVAGALRIARTVTGRAKIVYFTDSYHGIDGEVLGRRIASGTLPIAPGIPPDAVKNALILDYGDPRSLEIIEANAGEIAAILVEPVQSRRPAFVRREFLHALRELTSRRGIALIFDELITGFRCHLGGAQAWFGIQADIATYGKVIGGGMPIGAIAGKAVFLDAFDGGYWSFGDDSFPEAAVTFFAGTFVRHPLALAAAKAALTHLKKEGPALQKALGARTAEMIGAINGALAGTPFSLDHFSSNWLIHTTPDFCYPGLLFALLRHQGIHILENRPCFLSTAHSEADIAQIISAFKTSVAELREAGFLGAGSSVPSTTAGAAPLTESQRELILLSQQSPAASTACNETWTLLLGGELDLEAMRDAVQEIIDRHDALRSTYAASGETLSVAPSLILDVPLTDLSELPAKERDSRFMELRTAQGLHVFDLQKGPLLAVEFVKLGAGEFALVFNAHHLACDGWSCDIFLNELSALYSAAREARPHSLPEPMQMQEYARLEEEFQSTPEFAAETAFWLGKFRSLPPLLELPVDHPYPTRRTWRGAAEIAILPADLPHALTRLGARHGATLFTVLLAAYKTLLFRLTGQDDLVTGVPAAGQNIPGGEHLVGHCVNMLPMRSQLDGAQPFSDFLKDLQTTVSEASENRRVTFGWLLRNLGVPRAPGRVPLIPSTFNLDPPLSHIHFSGLTHRLEANPRSAFQFDLSISCDTATEGFRTICKYNADLFEAATIRRWLGYFHMLLREIIHDADRPLGLIPFVPETEHDSPIGEWNATGRDYPNDLLLHELFEAQADKTPGNVAVLFGERKCTYSDLNGSANRLARRLQQLGVRRDVLVGIRMERSIEMVAAMLAVLKAGGAYVPLDPSYPPERLDFMVRDAGMPVILTQKKFSGSAGLPVHGSTVLLCADEEESDPAGGSSENLHTQGSPGDIAYVIYTSGTTGKPKGVMIPHRAICNHMLWMQEEFPLVESDRVLQKTPISFDASVWEFYAPLLAGATLVMAAPGGHLDSRYLARTVAEEKITILQLVPSMLDLLLAEPRFGKDSRLKRLFCGGEALSPELCSRFFAALSCELINLYGPTECAIDTLFHRCRPGEGAIPIGRPVANTRVFILDSNRQAVPPGVAGELCIAGAQLARGYWNDTDLTAVRFIAWNGERIYLTGDLARWNTDGEVIFLGRMDHQVKLRGNRVELGEIESTLHRQHGVASCAAVVREEPGGGKRLVAYVVQRESTAGDVRSADMKAEWLAALQKSLPDYMVPSAIVILPALPRLPNGKLDRGALPAPPLPSPDETETFAAPRNPLEQKIAEIWTRMLLLDRIGIHDNFFELGGESLLGLRVVNALRDLLQTDISLGVIFDAPTIAGMAEYLHSHHAEAVARLATPANGSSDPNGENAPPSTFAPQPMSRVSRKLRRVSATSGFESEDA